LIGRLSVGDRQFHLDPACRFLNGFLPLKLFSCVIARWVWLQQFYRQAMMLGCLSEMIIFAIAMI